MNHYVEALRKYAVFSGRARRAEYWIFVLFNTLAVIMISAAGTIMDSTALANTLVLLFTLAILIPTLAVTVRRLHDTGRSGWWVLIQFVPVVGMITLLVFCVLDSQRGANAYGPDPKSRVLPPEESRAQSEPLGGAAGPVPHAPQSRSPNSTAAQHASASRDTPMKTYLIGRSARCAVRLDDPSVSRLHAELTVTDDGRLFLLDRASTEGTFRRVNGAFQPLRQDFVEASDTIRLGNSECRVSDWLRQLQAMSSGPGDAQPRPASPKGPVKRDPLTGAIIDG